MSCCSPSQKSKPPTEKKTAQIPGLAQKSWQVTGMDCPNCARKLEQALMRLPGVDQAQVRFATERLIVHYDARVCSESAIHSAAEKVALTLLDSNSALMKHPKKRAYFSQHLLTFIVLLGVAWLINMLAPYWGRWAFTGLCCWALFPVVKKSLASMRSGTPFSIETLMATAAMGALLLGDAAEATVVLLLFIVGEQLEAYAAGRARSGVTGLMQLLPNTAVRMVDGRKETVAIADLQVGDCIAAVPGDRLAADGVLISEQAYLDESPLTGESMPVEHQAGDTLMAGTLVVGKPVQMQVTSEAGTNAIDRIVQLIEEAENNQAPIERFIDRFSRWYTPLMLILAVIIAIGVPLVFNQPWGEWIYKSLTLLLIACPCALVISTPTAITSALAAATRQGILIKGGAVMEQLAHIRTMAFDKTGTLTEGTPQVVDIEILASFAGDQQDLLAIAAAIEQHSNHPLAQAIVQKAADLTQPEASDIEVLGGIGVQGIINHQRYHIMAPRHWFVQHTGHKSLEENVEQRQQQGQTLVLITREDQPIGLIALQDRPREEAKTTVEALRVLGVESLMLTGDNRHTAAALAQTLNIPFQAELLPEDKLIIVDQLGRYGAMIGDGINDAPALKAASVGISMASGVDMALEASDCAISHNRLDALPKLIRLARATSQNIRQNIALALGLKGIFLLTTLLGLTGLWLAVLADSGATVLVTLNALRLLQR